METRQELERRGFTLETVKLPGHRQREVLVRRVDDEVVEFARCRGEVWYPQEFQRYPLLTAGYGGVTGHHPSGSAWSQFPDTRVELYYARVAEGGWIVDKRPAISSRGVSVALNCPLVDLTLSAREVEAFNDTVLPDSVVLHGVAAAGNWAAQRKIADWSWTGLDRVGLEVFIEYWIGVGGQVGQRLGNEIEWAGGEREVVCEYYI